MPNVESGTVTLLGATTGNPSFALNAAVLARAQGVRFDPLADDALVALLARALEDRDRGLGAHGLRAEPAALDAIARWADGDARRALTLLEHVSDEARAKSASALDVAMIVAAAKGRTLRDDRDGEEH